MLHAQRIAIMSNSGFIHYPPIEKHGVIGDRRTAALVAADGTIDWFCAPDYDGHVVFGAILDADSGGFCRYGPEIPALGEQHYEESTMCLETKWTMPQGGLALTDFMPWPDRNRPVHEEQTRIILRRMQASEADVQVRFEIRARFDFDCVPRVDRSGDIVNLIFDEHVISVWSSFEITTDEDGIRANFTLPAGGEAWVMIGLGEGPNPWDVVRCRKLYERTRNYWSDWAGNLKEFSEVGATLRRCAMTVHLLAHAPTNASVAAATTSLPERIGGDRNYDYRYTWVRDASISAAFLATMGDHSEVAKYFQWLCRLDSQVAAPLQVCYRTDGQPMIDEHEVAGLMGYLGSKPVRVGNRACMQRQIGSLGWFADSAWIFLEAGGEWQPEFWDMLRRSADHVCCSWQEPDSGVWELVQEAHYVASKVMAWVTVDRAIRVAERLGEEITDEWIQTCATIHSEVLSKGWCEERGAFRQRYDSEALDAAALLIPLMGFLPSDDPRVTTTLEAIEDELMIDGLVYRFVPSATLGGEQLAVGDFEAAFLPATFWYAHALARAGRTEQALGVLRHCEEIAGGPGIFAEEVDPRNHRMLGNTPLLFSQVEYGRALQAIHENLSHQSNQHEES